MKELDAARQIFIPGPEKEQHDAHWPPEVRKANAHPKNRFGHFVLVAQVGCGASGTVFRAWDTRWKQFAAVKILHKMSAADLERFALEAPHAAALRHPAIASMYEAGELDGQWYVAMSYVDGQPIDAQPRSVALNVKLVRDACRAVDHAHRQGITHGDLKPSNLLVDRQGGVFVTDFGFKGANEQDDVRDLGAVLYTVLAGHTDVSPELADVLTRATAEDPADRTRTAGEMADELDRIQTGRRGLASRLARKWLPVGLGGAALALVFTWLAPSFLTADDAKTDHYQNAALALLRIEESDNRASRLPNLDELTARMPTHLHARVLKARAAYVGGDRETAKRELASFAEYESMDYRVPFLRVLMEFEEALAQPLPLPAPEAPAGEWEGSLPDWRRFHDALSEVAKVRVDKDSPLYAEHRRDAEAALALASLAEGQWLVACDRLNALNQRLPVYIAARRAASYLARRFDQVLDEPGTQFALAIESSHSPCDDLKRLRPLFAGREATLVCWAARRCVAQGIDPSNVTAEGLDAESRGILAVAQLKWRALAGRDAESEYASARKLLENPATWMGRLASIEALIGLGRRLKLRGGDSAAFEEAITRIDALSREWSGSRLLRAEALLGLNRCEEALAEAKQAQSNSVREHLISAAASLRLAFRDERCLEDAMVSSDRAVARGRAHPEALALQAAIAILAAQTRQECPISLSEAVEKLTAALDRAPDYLEARFHRASANHLLSERAPEPQRRDYKRAAIEDLNRVLDAAPDLAAARALRGIVRGSVEDLREALKRDCSEADEVKKWIRAAEAVQGRK
jgi:tRNA A-37 threonylcarbamoyl transferase component Bud32